MADTKLDVLKIPETAPLRKKITEKDVVPGSITKIVTGDMYLKNGLLFPQQATTASRPTYVKGGIYFDITANKLYIGGASGWEEVTSV